MRRLVKPHQAEAYEIYETAQQLSIGKDARVDVAGIKDKDATIVAMSKILVSMMEILKVENVVRLRFAFLWRLRAPFLHSDLQTTMSPQTPTVVKRAHALREAGPDKSMKRILPRAVEDVNKSIARGQDKRSERERAGHSNINKRPAWYWEGCLGLMDEKESGECSNVVTNGNNDCVSGDLIKL